jgi:hypothetical protein
MANVNVYTDGFNLYYGALKRTPYKWLDLGLLARTLLPTDTVQEIHYFTARVSSRPYSPTSAHDQGLYIRALKTVPNLQIKYGHFLTHSVPMYLTNVTPAQKVWVDKTEEKASPTLRYSRRILLRRVDYVRVLPSGRILARGFACRRSVASICNDHHKACSLNRPAQRARASAA